MPGVGWNRNVHPVAALPTDNVKLTANAVDGLVEDEIVFQRVGPEDVVIVRILRSPDNTGGAVLGSGDGLELCLDEAVLDAGVLLEEQRVGRAAGLLDHFGF